MPIPQQPIAIVGVSALFPGSADASGFWRDILAGRDLLTDVPASHWRIDDYFDPNPAAPDKTYAKRGGFLNPVDFDALHWGVPPSTLPATDTSQLLALIVAQAVLQDAAREQFEHMDRSRISVILGVTSAQELLFSMVSRLQRPVWVKALRESGIPEDEVQAACTRIAAHYVPWQEASFPGLLGNVVAGRIANRLNLGGTNCVTDAACASSLSALAMAVSELRLGQSDLAIAGGVDTLNDIFMYMCFSKTPALSPSGDCRPFSEQADGTMLGEGLGMVALKRLSDAERDGDRIYAVLRGIGTASDGRSKSVYAPVSAGQALALQRAYDAAGYGPQTVELVEAHGTGTKAGDIAEFEGLRLVYAAASEHRQWCALGSVKSQIGHTKAAAGAAGLFKAIMALHHKVLPPTIKVDAPNPKLQIENSPFYLNTRARPWIRDNAHPRRAAVSAFGFGGSNFHVTLEEYRGPAPCALRLPTQSCELLLLHADNVADLLAQAAAMARSDLPLAHVAHASRQHWNPNAPHRLALVAASIAQLRDRLSAAISKVQTDPQRSFTLPDGCSYGCGSRDGKIAFLFPGQGSQYLNMGDTLAMQFAAAREVWDRAAQVSAAWDSQNEAQDRETSSLPQASPRLADPLGANSSRELFQLTERVFPRPAFGADESKAQLARLTATEWTQPALAAHSLALLAVLRDLGVRADLVAGHSFGELLALHATGVFDADSALILARARGLAMRDAAGQAGAMCAVSEPIERVREWLNMHPDVVIANHNGPRQVVVSGALPAIAAFEADLLQKQVACTRLPVASAFHSPLVAAASETLAITLDQVAVRAPQLPVFGNCASTYPLDALQIRQQLAGQLAKPVQFVQMIEAMYAAGARCFVEVGPGQVLSGLVAAILGERPHQVVPLDRKNRDGLESLLIGLARLAANGAAIDPQSLFADVRLPPVPAPRPKHAIAINGSNIGKPYPPADGALPSPNLARPVAPVLPVSVSTTRVETPSCTPTPATRTSTTPTISRPIPMPAARDIPADWLLAFQETQAQTAAAHEGFQRSMADSHTAYLRLAESALTGLTALLGAPGAPIQQSVPVGASLPRELAPPVQQSPQGTIDEKAKSSRHEVAPTGDANPVGASLPRELSPPARGTELSPPAPQKLNSAVVAIPQPSISIDLPALLLSIVAEKTGYPVDMLNLNMDLEGDLGIDSIKRVEILAAVDEHAPQLPKVERARLGAMRTLAEIVAALGSSDQEKAKSSRHEVAPTATANPVGASLPRELSPLVPQSSINQSPAINLPALLLNIVAEKTGYPVDMLNLNMDLEGDLGIDSIKRVEILATVDERAPELPKVDRARLGAMRTLAEIVAALGSSDQEKAKGSRHEVAPTGDANPVGASLPRELSQTPQTGGSELARDQGLDMSNSRFEVEWVAAPLPGLVFPGLLGGDPISIIGHAAIGAALAEQLQRFGVHAQVVKALPATANAVIYLGGLRDFTDVNETIAVNTEAFQLARQLATQLHGKPGLFVSVQDTQANASEERAWAAGLPALIKTCALEWPQASLKSIDIQRAGRDAASLAQTIVQELLGGGADIEIALSADGQRRSVSCVPRSVTIDGPVIDAGDVVVVSGGARGVTAACLIAWAQRCPARFVLLGRTPLLDEPKVCAGILDESGLKQVLLSDAKTRGENLTPAVLSARVQQVMAAREIRQTLAALVVAGCCAQYRAVAVEDSAAVTAVLAEVRAKIGPIRALIHAAGVIADKRIADKTDAQFSHVFATKVAGLRALLDATRGDDLKLLCVFSSVSARCGNVGQVDYAMANEVLNQVAASEKRRRPALRVKALGWGPWEAGMVTPALRAHFTELGVPLLPLRVGAQLFVDELHCDGALQLVLGGEPLPPAASRVEANFDSHIDLISAGWRSVHSASPAASLT